MNEGEDIGFNARQVTVVSAGVGVRLTSFLTLKTEYSWYEFALVRGVPAAVRDEAGSHNQFGIGATFWF